MSERGVWIALAVIMTIGLATMAAGSARQEQRKDCMDALATPGVSDPAYNNLSVEFAEGLEECMEMRQ